MAGIFGTLGAFLIVILLAGGLYGCPQYNVYTERMNGEAALARAEYEKQTNVQAAKAKLDSAQLLADAEVKRAEGIAKANKIIADGLGGPEGYLRWRYIEMLEETSSSPGKTIIYVPTEAGLPLLEAGKR